VLRARERATRASRLPPWVRHEHEERYAFAAGFVRGAVVVDVACGDGAGSEVYANEGARRIHAFDLSSEAVELTNARGLPTVTAAVADARTLPLEDESADVLITLETIEHVPEYERFVSEIVRILRPGGTLVCSTPNRKVYSPGTARDGNPWNPFHVKEFDLDELEDIVHGNFVDVRWFGQNPSNRRTVAMLDRLGRILPLSLAVRLRQVWKLRMLPYDRPERHAVRPLDKAHPPEIVVLVGKKPTS
jgi:SAM-dependent methyltransferase